MINKKIIILGAGPCGLTAAWELAKAGVHVTVIEREPSVGGLCKTNRCQGYQFDLGGHRFISKDTSLIQDVSNLMNNQLLRQTRRSIIKMDGKEIQYPINWKNIFTNFSFSKNLEFVTGYVLSTLGLAKPNSPAGSFENWADRNFGKPLNDIFFKPYTEKLWGVPSSELSDDWAAQRISLLNALDLLIQSTGLFNKKSRSYASTYLYPRGGIGEIFETMAESIRELGGSIITSCEPIRLETTGNKISGIRIKSKDMGETLLNADDYLSTIPLNSLMPLLEESNPVPLRYRSLRFLNLKLGRRNFSPNTWIYVPEANLRMTRIQEPKRRSPESAPENKTSLILEIPCTKGDSTWNMEESALLDLALSDMKKLGFDIRQDLEGYFSCKEEHAYPLYNIGYADTVKRLFEKISHIENLESLGRHGLFRYLFMDTAMLMGREWGRSLLAQNRDMKIHEMDSAQVLLEGRSVA